MDTMSLDTLVENEDFLVEVRSLLFPSIRERTITGYNIHAEFPKFIWGGFTFDYYHSDLGVRDNHYRQLEGILRREGFLHSIRSVRRRTVSKRLLERYATYRQLPHWDKKGNMRVFTLEGRELSPEEAATLRRECIVEQRQYMLRLGIDRPEELRHVADLFKKYTAVFKLDRLGRPVPAYPDSNRFKENIDGRGERLYIEESWKVPLLAFKGGKKPANFRDFLMVSSFLIAIQAKKDSYGVVQVFVHSKKDAFKAYLDSKDLKQDQHYLMEKAFALRTFVDYLDK